MATVEETVLLYVADNPKCSAIYILQQLNSKCPAITKAQINKILYDAEEDNIAIKTNAIPPLWSVTQKGLNKEESHVESSEEDLTMVLIDLDTQSISDCLKPLKPYINSTLDVLAFKTTDFGIKREIESDNFKIIVAYPNGKNIHTRVIVPMLTWVICKRCRQYTDEHKKAHFIVVSKNPRLTYLPELVGGTGHKCTIVKDWSELRLYVE